MDTNWPPDLSSASGSKYIVLLQSLRAAIRSGTLPAQHRLPPVRELAWQLGITPGTVARAYKLANDEGLLDTAVGRGTFVAGDADRAPVVDEPLINTIQADTLDFRACRVADLGQGRVIRDILMRMAQGTGSRYTDYPTSDTDLAARKAVVDWIGQDRAGRLAADDIVLGFGAQNAVMMVLQACLSGPTPVILTEELAYPGVRHAARLLRAKLVGVAMDQEGIRPDRLAEAYRTHGGQVLLTAAEVHSPTTTRTSHARRQEIADLARKFQLQIIEDDCHRVANSDIPGYRALCPERGWYVSSLTKSVSATLRFGFAACPSAMARAARQVAQSSFYGMPQPILDLCAELLRSGEAERIRQGVEKINLQRVHQAVNILGQWDIRWRSDVPFIWLRLPQGWRGSTFATACEARGIRIKPADEFALPDGAAPHAVRLALNAIVPQPQFEAGLKEIAAMLANPPPNVDL
ncbi:MULTISPECIES: aminotransferase-like domain-containing protein [Actibacterium]|uniref:DNA-binding transcriptional MocR family regulator n=1 Tax=Actibacterium naphthalenivorans TaxID=1614693 RepID=A0A840C8L8_9RHOB|nr:MULTISPECIES: PLP-dependent aminotransferase family protein [Actibacterium]ALG90375.1 GntR family transcriptional regulator [Actibacterium sp. EMB200-NS6]MBB4022304.1 DNA-binding transcriptional MocR family regulator [Actibacterium naphthalenivorans]